MERTIRVKGTGKIALAPDLVRVRMEFSAKSTDYAEVYQISAAYATEAKDAFEELGFRREDLKTVSFWVNPEYEGYQAEDMSWKQRLTGYSASQAISVEFDRASGLLGKVLGAASELSSAPTLSIEYALKDPEEAKQQLLADAVADSMRKAKTLAEAAGVGLGQIVTVDYSWESVSFGVRPLNSVDMREMKLRSASVEAFAQDIEPEEIRAEDTVTVIWEITD